MNWQLPKLGGTKETIKAKVGEAKLPQTVKDFILSEVATLGDASIVSVTGYSADHSNPAHLAAVTRNIQITISSAVI